MKKISIFLILCLPLIAFALVLEVNQDGSGDYLTIQSGFDGASNGDTLLIYPGRYIENLKIHDKDINMMSLYAVTQDTSYISNTIIDGNHESNTIFCYDAPQGISITGVTITNGYCHQGMNGGFQHGAGIMLLNGNQHIVSHCVIEYNFSERSGGGVFFTDCSLYLKGTIIRHNVANLGGGGLAFCNDEVVFDEEDLNSIFANYGGHGSDIYNAYGNNYEYYFPMQKGTSNPPDGLYFLNYTSDDMFNVSYEECFIPETAQEVYVSPYGDNSNDGLSEETPLRNIWFATLKCQGTEEVPGIIHLAPGVYSSSSNDELTVSALKSNMQLIGCGSDLTTIDHENKSGTLTALKQDNCFIQGFTICNSSAEFLYQCIDFTGLSLSNMVDGGFKDIVCRNIHGVNIDMRNYNEFQLDNVRIYNAELEATVFQIGIALNAEIRNLLINTVSPVIDDDTGNLMGAYSISISRTTSTNEPLYCSIENLLITGVDNASPSDLFPQGGVYAVHSSGEDNTVDIINATISGNTADYAWSGPLGVSHEAEMNIYNSIVYDNEYFTFHMRGDSYIGVTHSLVEGGLESCVNIGTGGVTEWHEGNLDIDADPGFCGVGAGEFTLEDDSPCIDSGTLDLLPEGYEVSETDLAGNPRIYGDGIDMGCYEWQGIECDFSWEQDDNFVSFELISNVDIYEAEWDFDCDGEVDSNELNPSHTYPENGMYSVGVSINNGIGGRKYEYCIVIETNEVIEDVIPQTIECRNYPNPFNPKTTIEFTIPEKGEVKLSIYDVKGRRVTTMLNATLEAGQHDFIWDGKNNENEPSASGIYFYEIIYNNIKERRKINLLK